MRIVGVTGVAKSISGALLLIAIAGALHPAAAGTIVRPIYPQDELLLDLIVRTSRDPDLLTPRQTVLQYRLQRMGVDAILAPRRPDIGTALSARLMERVRHDRWAPPRVRLERRWDRTTGLVITWEISEATIFTDAVDTNVAGVVIRTPPDPTQPGVRVRVDDLDRYLISTGSVALEKELALQLRNRQAAQAGSGELLNFTIPIRLPRTLERIIGKGEATNIRISGTQRISIGGQSTVSDNFVATELRQSQSLFPQLEFSQTLRVNLDGTVGEKIKVRISHDSEAVGAQSTEVRLSFEGDEDDIIQQIRAGDIEVTLPGSRLLGVGTGRGGLFGLKVQGAMGPIDFTVVTSKENARQGNQTFSQSGGTDAQQQFTIPSVNYIPSRFFRLIAPVSFYFTDTDSFPVPLQDTRSFALVVSEQNEGAPWEIDYASLEVYRTIGPGLSTEETIDGAVAYLDSTGIGFEGFGPGGAGRTPGDGNGTATYPESGFDPGQALAGLPQQYRERWERLRRGPDEDWELLEVNSTIVGIKLRRPAETEEVVAVSYNLVDVATGEIVRRVGRSSEDGDDGRIVDPNDPGRTINYFKLLKPGTPNQPVVGGNYTEFALTWEYEYRNFYDLLGRNIDPDGFEFRIESKDQTVQPPFILPGTELYFVTIFGLDKRKANNVAGSDGVADVGDVELFSLDEGFLRFDHPTPMALPDSVVVLYTDGALTELPALYKVPTLYTRLLTSRERAELHRLNFVGSQTSTSSRLRLNAFNILEGSEEVFLDGELMTRGKDYDIDYLSGEINLKGDALARLTSQTRIEVRYENDPLFGGGRTSLSGANLQWNFGRNNLLSTTWLYQTRPNSQTKIRFGEEPKRNLVGNLQAKLRFDPGWTRRISDIISRENVQQNASMIFDAEIAMSVPNPNTRDEAYLDDFENADQATQIPMVREGWWWASLPVRGPDASGLQREAFQPEDRAYQGWHRVPEGSLQRGYTNPDLSEAESREIYTTMEVRMVAKDPAGWTDDEYAGIMRGLGEVDLSRAQYLEFWVDDGTGYIDPQDPTAIEAGRPGRLHFDFGQINEDFFWKVDENGDYILGQWDKEDTDNDGLLGIAIDGESEDRGLDGLLNSQESALQALPGRPSRPEDPAGDDRDAVDTGGNTFIYINGTEQNQRLDSEDISFNNNFDRVDGFFRLTLELDDEAFVDPARDYANNPGFIEDLRQNDRSWRKYRLDLRQLQALQRGMDTNEPTVYGPAIPDLSRVRIFRIWYEPEGDGTDPAERRISFAEMRFLGNRWVADGIRDAYDQVIPALGDSVVTTEDFRLGVLNNKENPDYVPPIPVRVRNNVAELEQSLQFTYTDLQPGHRFRAKKDAGSRGEDYLDYGEFNFFWRIPYRNGGPDPMQTDAEGYFWIGSDSTSYYEISVPFGEVTANANGWVEVSVALADLTNIKNTDPDSLVRYPEPGRVNPEVRRGRVRDTQNRNVYDVTILGAPDLGTIQDYYVGVRYRQPDPAAPLPPPYSGEVLFNELRLRDVNRKTGYAQRYAANFTFPGLGEVSGEFSNTDEEFRGLDRERGSGVERRDYAIRGSTRLQNFLPLFGIEIPIQLSHRLTEELPKYAPRTDIELPVDARSEFISRRIQESFSLQFRKRQPSPRWWLKYTLDPFAFQINGGRTRNDRPERLTRNQTLNWTYSYDLNLRRVPSIGVPFTRSRFTWLPNQVTTNSRWNYTRNLSQETTAGVVLDPTVQATRQMTNDATVRWRPFETLPVTWVVTSVRDLLLAENPAYRRVLGDGRWLGINVGFEVRYSESLSLQYRPNFRWLNWARPNIDVRAGYNEDRNPLRREPARAPEFDTVGDGRTGVPTQVRTVGNSRDVTVRAELALVAWVRRFIASQGPQAFGFSLRQSDVADTTGTVEEGGGGIPEFFGRTLKGLSRGFWDLRPISLNVQHKQAASFTHVNGRADLAYRLGITDEPDFGRIEPLAVRRLETGEVLLQDYSAFQQTIQRSVRMNSQTSLSDNLRVDGSFDWSRNNTRRYNSGNTYTRRMEWPNLTFRMANVQGWRVFQWMGRPMESSDISVNYRRSVSANGREGDPREYPSRQWAWQPRWNARLSNGMDTSLTVARNGETRESAGQGTLENRQLSVTARLDKKFDARGRMSFLRFGQSGVGSTIDMTLSVSWTNSSNWRERNGIRDQDRSSKRLSIDPQFTYQFTRNLRGSLRLNYSRSVLTVSTTQTLGVFFDAVLNF